MSVERPAIGIVREWKTTSERRTPLTPADVRALVGQGLRVVVEPSEQRTWPDDAYLEAGAELGEPQQAELLVGIKEMPADRLAPGRPHLFFSHTIKAQPYNMALLQRVLDERCTLLDYELVRGEDGKRTIFFGVQAGQAGMINGLHTLGRRLAVLGDRTPLADVRQAREYESLQAALEHLDLIGERLRSEPLSPRLQPIVVGLTGAGHVARGALEVIDRLRPFEIRAADLRAGRLPAEEAVVLVQLADEDLYAPKAEGAAFEKAECRAHPEKYRGRLGEVLPQLSLLVTGHYWDPRFPVLVTREQLAEITADESARLAAIADVTCDIEGSVACTLRPTKPENPIYVYDPATHTATDGVQGPGMAVMAVEILPTELPRDSSALFGAALRPHLEALVACDWSRPFEELALPAVWKEAIIAHAGALAPAHASLAEHLPRREA